MPAVAIQKISFSSRVEFVKTVYSAAMRAGLNSPAARILTAHMALSTGWGKSVDNWRLAGAKADTTWRESKPYTEATGCECVDGLENQNDSSCICEAGKGQSYTTSYWRAYNTIDESMADILRLLKGARYTASWAYLTAGNPEYFTQVGRDGWYTADPVSTAASMTKHLETICRMLGVDNETTVAEVALVGATALAVWWLWQHRA